LRTARRNLGNTAGRTSRRLVVVDGNFRNPRHDRSTAGAKSENREVLKREKGEDQGSLHANRLEISFGRIPQKAGIPGGVTSLAEIARVSALRRLDAAARDPYHVSACVLSFRAESRNLSLFASSLHAIA